MTVITKTKTLMYAYHVYDDDNSSSTSRIAGVSDELFSFYKHWPHLLLEEPPSSWRRRRERRRVMMMPLQDYSQQRLRQRQRQRTTQGRRLERRLEQERRLEGDGGQGQEEEEDEENNNNDNENPNNNDDNDNDNDNENYDEGGGNDDAAANNNNNKDDNENDDDAVVVADDDGGGGGNDNDDDQQQQQQQQQDDDTLQAQVDDLYYGTNGDDDNAETDDDYADIDDAWTLMYGDGDDYYEEDFSLWYLSELRDSTAEDYRKVFSKQVTSTKAQPPISFLTLSLCFCLCLVMLIPYFVSVRKSFKKNARRRNIVQRRKRQQQQQQRQDKDKTRPKTNEQKKKILDCKGVEAVETETTSNPTYPTGSSSRSTPHLRPPPDTTSTRGIATTTVKNGSTVVNVNVDADVTHDDTFLFGRYDYYAAMKEEEEEEGDRDTDDEVHPQPQRVGPRNINKGTNDNNQMLLVPKKSKTNDDDIYYLARDDCDGAGAAEAAAADDDDDVSSVGSSSSSLSVINASASLYMDDGIMADDPNMILRDFAAMVFNNTAPADQGGGGDGGGTEFSYANTKISNNTNQQQGNGNDETDMIMDAYCSVSSQVRSSSLEDEYDDDDDDDDDSVASGWIEQYDRKQKQTVYCNAISGEIVTKKPVNKNRQFRPTVHNTATGPPPPPAVADVWDDEGIEHVEGEMVVNMTMTASSIGIDESYDLSTAKSNSNVSMSTAGDIIRRPMILIRTCCSRSSSNNRMPWYFYYCSGEFLRKVRKSARYDDEMKSILSITLPFLTRTIVVDVFGLMEVGVIGQLLGTRALSAYFAVELVIEVATMFLHGLPASLSSLVPQSIGAGNFKLAGLYTQLCVWSYLMLYFPCLLFWWNKFDGIVEWLGFDEETSLSAQQYGEFAMICKAVLIFDEALHCVLNAAGFEAYSTFMNGMKAFLSFMTVVMISSLLREEEEEELTEQEQFQQQMQERWADDDEEDEGESGIQASLWMIGAVHLVLTLFFLISNIIIIVCNELLMKCRNGMLPWKTNPLSKGRPIKTFFRAAIPLSIGFLFKYCEFQLLFLFAAIMGPAQVAAWGLLGAIWQVAENLAIAFSTASKIRVANLLGSGRPSTAHYSSEKSLFLCVVFSSSLATFLGIFHSSVPGWFTNDETLQKLVRHQMPLLCLGVALMSFASMSWAHLCAQGRSYIASGVTILGSIFITLPLVSVSTFSLSYGLQGLLAGMILGYAASAFVCTVLVLTSDWSAISRIVMKRNIRTQKRLKKEKKIDYGSNIPTQK